MNIKKMLIIIEASLCLSVFCGCSDSSEPAAEFTQPAGNNYAIKDTDTVISGEVTDITGNKVTLALGTIDRNRTDNSSQENIPEMNGERPDFGDDMPEMKGERPDFGGDMPEMNGERPDFGSDMLEMKGERSGKGGRKSASIEKSGEEESYIIPVGMPIDGLTGRNSDYSGITVGTILTLTVNSDGIVCAASAE